MYSEFAKHEYNLKIEQDEEDEKVENKKVEDEPKKEKEGETQVVIKIEQENRKLGYKQEEMDGARKCYSCSFCPKTFHDTKGLQIHTASHEKRFQCPMCDRKFVKKQILGAHIRSHETGKKFICSVCYRLFASNSGLAVHRKKHKGLYDDMEKEIGEINKCKYRLFHLHVNVICFTIDEL